MIQISAKSHQDAAVQLADHLKKQGWPKIGCKPWNRFDPYMSHWLVIPSTDWPAYRYGKYFFIPGENSDEVLCGLTVEKGLGQNYLLAFPVPKARPLIMDDEWAWQILLDDLSSGTFQSSLDRIVTSLNGIISIEITAGPIDDPEVLYDPDSLIKWDHAKFAYGEKGLTLAVSEINDGCLKEIAQVNNCSELGQCLINFPNTDWMWVNFDIHMKVSLTHDPQIGSDESIQGLWNNYLVNLDRWFC
jgi:hypothetical protein